MFWLNQANEFWRIYFLSYFKCFNWRCMILLARWKLSSIVSNRYHQNFLVSMGRIHLLAMMISKVMRIKCCFLCTECPKVTLDKLFQVIITSFCLIRHCDIPVSKHEISNSLFLMICQMIWNSLLKRSVKALEILSECSIMFKFLAK